MKLFSSLDPADRRMLFAIVGLVVALLILLAFATPAEDAGLSSETALSRTG